MKKSSFLLPVTLLFTIVLIISVSLNISYREEIAKLHSLLTKEDVGVKQWMLANSEVPEHIINEIYNEVNTYEDTDLLLAIIKVESNFNPLCKSSKDALGLMGITPKWWLKELEKMGIVKSRRDLYKIKNNIKAGSYILNKKIEKNNKNIEKALEAYSGKANNYSSKVFRALGEINYARVAGKWNK